MAKEGCPSCGARLRWDPWAREWVCQCGEVFTDDELEAARTDQREHRTKKEP